MIDLRLVCDEDEDFAAPAGPSVRGGGKIAAAIGQSPRGMIPPPGIQRFISVIPDRPARAATFHIGPLCGLEGRQTARLQAFRRAIACPTFADIRRSAFGRASGPSGCSCTRVDCRSSNPHLIRVELWCG
ncbi:hypothetical protein ACFQU2_37185 [Siccirubricoccus deserti]